MKARFSAPALVGGVALVAAAIDGPAADVRAVAAAAGSLFEAAPFVLAVAFLTGYAAWAPAWLRRLAPGVALAGCGCTRGRIPGALAIPAVALTAIAFGPVVTTLRIVAGLALAAFRSPFETKTISNPIPDPLAELERLAACAFVAAVAVGWTGRLAHGMPWPILFFMGLGIGAIAPCATAAVAIAMAFAHVHPPLAWGMLTTGGLVSLPRTRAVGKIEKERVAVIPTIGLAFALALLAFRGPSGFVNPRLLVPIALGSVVAAAIARSTKTRSAAPMLVPLIMLAAVASPAVPLAQNADAANLEDAFPGERLTFEGVVSGTARATTLERFAITCCRLDATRVALPLEHRLSLANGSWAQARGTLVRDAAGTLVLRTAGARPVVPPTDPFIYR